MNIKFLFIFFALISLSVSFSVDRLVNQNKRIRSVPKKISSI